jgi:single-strand DNA-binding protein
MYQNSVDIMGYLGSDAETKTIRDGVPFTVLSLATKRSWKDAQGEWQSHTDWHRVTCFGNLAEFAAGLKKGAHVHITGYLRSREVEKPVTGKSKKSSATVKVQLWEVRAIRIAKLDRTAEENPSTDIPADDPAS